MTGFSAFSPLPSGSFQPNQQEAFMLLKYHIKEHSVCAAAGWTVNIIQVESSDYRESDVEKKGFKVFGVASQLCDR